MEQQPLKLGFIGGSINSAVGYTHYIASQMDHRWQVVAGCFSRTEATNKATAERWGIEDGRVYTSWRDMLSAEQGKLDAIAILTPTDQHADIVVEVLASGFNVICEKALTNSAAEAERIIEAQQKSGRFLSVTYNYTGYPMVRELCSLIKAGHFGRVHQIQIEMPQEGFVRVDAEGRKPVPQSWRLEDKVVPTISLDLGVHLHNMVYMLSGQRPLKVMADQSSFGWFPEVVDNVMSIAKYQDGMKCQMWFSKSALGHRNGLRVRVFGERASAEWYQMNPEELILNAVSGSREIKDRAAVVSVANQLRFNRFKAGHPAGFLEAFANLYVDLADALIEFNTSGSWNNPWVFGADIALEGLQMFEAIDQSAKSEAWVTL